MRTGHRILGTRGSVAKRKPFYADIFYVGFSTGMRIGEINALEWKDIDFEKMEIHVNGTLIKTAARDR